MLRDDLVDALAAGLPRELAEDLVDDFLTLREDVATSTFGRTAPGKFVETVVQSLQHLETGSYEPKPSIDSYLRQVESRGAILPDGLRIAAARIARGMYTLRSKRSIAHKGEVDPNQMDLRFLLAAAEWVLAELVRTISGVSTEQASRIIWELHRPIPDLVDPIDGRSLVLKAHTARQEILILLHSRHPEPVTRDWLKRSADRLAAKTVSNTIGSLWKSKELHKLPNNQLKLTPLGLAKARSEIATLLA